LVLSFLGGLVDSIKERIIFDSCRAILLGFRTTTSSPRFTSVPSSAPVYVTSTATHATTTSKHWGWKSSWRESSWKPTASRKSASPQSPRKHSWRESWAKVRWKPWREVTYSLRRQKALKARKGRCPEIRWSIWTM